MGKDPSITTGKILLHHSIQAVNLRFLPYRAKTSGAKPARVSGGSFIPALQTIKITFSDSRQQKTHHGVAMVERKPDCDIAADET